MLNYAAFAKKHLIPHSLRRDALEPLKHDNVYIVELSCRQGLETGDNEVRIRDDHLARKPGTSKTGMPDTADKLHKMVTHPQLGNAKRQLLSHSDR